jgi:hypothetical protein
MDNSYRLLDLTVYGRQEMWEDSPTGWPQRLKGKISYPYPWTSHRSVVSPEGRVFGRPGNGQALNRVYQYLDLVPNAATRRASILDGASGLWSGECCADEGAQASLRAALDRC